jgi:hypothetical protein
MLGQIEVDDIYNPLPSHDQQGVDKSMLEEQEEYVVRHLQYAFVMADS